MINKEEFLKKYNISKAEVERIGIEWGLMEQIYNNYLSIVDELETQADYIAKTFLKLKPLVHSVKYRVKDPEHLIEKIIRKKMENVNRNISVENYRDQITDLVGVRILHLFKDEWEGIHDFIEENWGLNEKPTANVRSGDSEKYFEEKGCSIKIHKAGYRSVHYLIKSTPRNKEVITEIQVRTIFEEAWSEIDHKVRYPYDTNNEMLAEYLVVFNRLAGSADEMGTFVKKLKEINENHKNELEIRDTQIQELNGEINKLRQQIEKLKINEKQKTDISGTVGKISDLLQIHNAQFLKNKDESSLSNLIAGKVNLKSGLAGITPENQLIEKMAMSNITLGGTKNTSPLLEKMAMSNLALGEIKISDSFLTRIAKLKEPSGTDE